MYLGNMILNGKYGNSVLKASVKKVLKQIDYKEIQHLLNNELNIYDKARLLNALIVLRGGHRMLFDSIKNIMTADEWAIMNHKMEEYAEVQQRKEMIKNDPFALIKLL